MAAATREAVRRLASIPSRCAAWRTWEPFLQEIGRCDLYYVVLELMLRRRPRCKELIRAILTGGGR